MSNENKDAIITARVPVELRDKYKLLCQAEGLTMSEHLRQYVEKYCEDYDVELKIVSKKKK